VVDKHSAALPSGGEVLLELSSLSELFVPATFDPWQGDGAMDAGVDRLLDFARAAPRPQALSVTIVVPADHLPPDATARTVTALRRWCDTRIAAHDRQLAVLRRRDRAAFLTGSVWLVACLSLAAALDSIGGLPNVLRLVVGEGLVIAAWVGIWKPVDILLYDRVEARRERRVLWALKDLPLKVRGR
jgi:hypothetical protein